MTVSSRFPPVDANARYQYEFHDVNRAAEFVRARWRTLFCESLASAGVCREGLGYALFHQSHAAQMDDLMTDLRLDPAAVPVVVFVPRASRLPNVLQTSARVEGSESAAVERLLQGPLASAYARYAVLVIGGVPSPATAEGAAALRRVIQPLAAAPQVAGVF